MGIKVLVMSDTHCGSDVGLTPPEWDQGPKKEGYARRRAMWNWWEENRPKKVDVLLFNGDAIEGKGQASGGAELLYSDWDDQVQMAIDILRPIKASEIVMSYGCLTPGHRVLTADLRYVPVESLIRGDSVLAFDENGMFPLRRQIKTTKVVANKLLVKPVYRIYLSDGTTLEASGDHPFLFRGRVGAYEWRTTEELYDIICDKPEQISFPRFLPVWDELDTYGAGYLAAFFDGEGSLNQATKEERSGRPEHILRINGYQNENPMLEKVSYELNELGFSFHIHDRADSENKNLLLLGGRSEVLRLLGSIRPARLLDRLDPTRLGTVKNPYDYELKIDAIEFIGDQEVCGLATEARTYIAEGFLNHNTAYHTGKDKDFEDDIAKELGATIASVPSVKIGNTTFDMRHHLGRSSILKGRLTSVLGEVDVNREWARRGEYPLADVILRSHVHYFGAAIVRDVMAVTLPSLQAYGTKYGSRRVSGTVDVGFMVFEINGPGKMDFDWHVNLMQASFEGPKVIK